MTKYVSGGRTGGMDITVRRFAYNIPEDLSNGDQSVTSNHVQHTVQGTGHAHLGSKIRINSRVLNPGFLGSFCTINFSSIRNSSIK